MTSAVSCLLFLSLSLSTKVSKIQQVVYAVEIKQSKYSLHSVQINNIQISGCKRLTLLIDDLLPSMTQNTRIGLGLDKRLLLLSQCNY